MSSYSSGRPNLSIPLSPSAIAALRAAIRAAYPAQQINSGVVHKLVAHGFAEIVPQQSPYPSHKQGHMLGFVVATNSGRTFVEQLDGHQ